MWSWPAIVADMTGMGDGGASQTGQGQEVASRVMQTSFHAVKRAQRGCPLFIDDAVSDPRFWVDHRQPTSLAPMDFVGDPYRDSKGDGSQRERRHR